MSRNLRPQEWRPVGVEDLEPAAWDVVLSTKHRSVIAGPGAGKTELLAQRACYLLQTGLCPSPKRILAISFKRDAAKNLKDRVEKRCHPEDAARFDSFTFDAFAKGMLDRFYSALPPKWRTTADYEILFPNYHTFSDFLDTLRSPPLEVATVGDVRAIRRNTFEKEHVLGASLPQAGLEAGDAVSWAAMKWWEDCLRAGEKSLLTFSMIGRLVELLLRVNPMIRHALRATYSHVFLDEFQDTTHVQYDLVKTSFLGSKAVLTAVGDNKQQIMRWAMALDDAFGKFEKDFGAKRVSLIRNYRSSPELVRIQHYLALAVDAESKRAESMVHQEFSEDACIILEFATPEDEAQHLAKMMAPTIIQVSLIPRDYAFLVKQKPADYAEVLTPVLKGYGIKARVEAELQDLLAERLTGLVLSYLRFGSAARGGQHWSDCCRIAASLTGLDPHDDSGGQAIQQDLGKFHATLRHKMNKLPGSEQQTDALLRTITGFLGDQNIRLLYPEYRQGDWYERVIGDVTRYLFQSCQATANWPSALDDFEGRDTVPIMTIHKSKGLEYHTVVFLGLDDRAWWSFRSQPEESRSAFFVAFSRAKQRVIFTYCESRGGRTEIASLYDILHIAGVKSQRIT